MSQQTNQFLVYVSLLMLTHGLSLAVLYLDVTGFRNELLFFFPGKTFLVYALGIVPVLLVPILFGMKIQTWRTFFQYLIAITIVGQASYVFADWLLGRFDDPFWVEDMEGKRTVEILRRSILPIVLVSYGAGLGQLKKLPRLIARRSV